MAFILSALLYLAIAILVLYAYIEYSTYQSIAFYTRQGLHYNWKPLIFALFSKDSKNPYEIAKELTEVAKGADLAITNIHGSVQICPLTPKALKEFYEKEQDHTTRVLSVFKSASGLHMDGDAPHIARGIYKKIYKRQNIGLFQPMILECLRKQIQAMRQRAEAQGGSFDFSLHEDFTLPFFNKMADRLVFGDSEEYLCIPELGNKSFYTACGESTQIGFAACFSLPNLISNGRYVRSGLSKKFKQHLAKKQKIRKYVDKVVDERCEGIEKGEYTPKRSNVVDFLILENIELKKANKQPYSKEDICQHIQDIYLVGIHTIMGVFKTLFFHLVFKENKEHFEELKRVVKEDFPDKDYSLDSLLDHPHLQAVFAEGSRHFPGINRSFPKTVVKPFKLCGVKIRKGDDVVVRYLSLNHNKENFPNPDKLDPSRFAESKKPARFTYLQFGHGVRGCVGRSFGEFAVKAFIVELLQEFDFYLPEGFEPNWSHSDLFSQMIEEKMILEISNK